MHAGDYILRRSNSFYFLLHLYAIQIGVYVQKHIASQYDLLTPCSLGYSKLYGLCLRAVTKNGYEWGIAPMPPIIVLNSYWSIISQILFVSFELFKGKMSTTGMGAVIVDFSRLQNKVIQLYAHVTTGCRPSSNDICDVDFLGST